MNIRFFSIMVIMLVCISGCQRATDRDKTPTPTQIKLIPTDTRIVVTGDMLVTPTPVDDTDTTLRQWYLTRIQAPNPQEFEIPPVRVAIIDTGIDMQHPDLVNQIVDTIDVFTEEQMIDRQGHGTHTAGIIAAQPNTAVQSRGICTTCQIVAIKAINDDGYGSDVTVAQGIDHAIEAKAVVINLSIGSVSDAPAIKAAIERAIAADILIVAAAGNNTQTTAENIFPAAYPGVLGVSAVDKDDQIASFAIKSTGIDIVAPGIDIFNTSPFGDGYSIEQGTSTAAPQVTATAAMVRAIRPELNAVQTQELLLMHTIDLGRPGYDTTYGYGLLNVRGVLQAARQADVTQRGQIRGRVIGADRTEITLQLNNESIALDPNAQFRQTNLAAGEYTLDVRYSDQQISIPVTLTGIGMFVTDINIWVRNGELTSEVNEQLP